MPSVRELQDRAVGLASAFMKRRDEKKHLGLLPKDLCDRVVEAARAEAANITAWVEKLDAEIARQQSALKAARAAARAECRPVAGPLRAVGSPLDAGYHMENGPTLGLQKTKAALAREVRTVKPLLERISGLERERYARQLELHSLKKIVRLAAAGEVTLLHFLTDQWRARLEIGAAVLGKLPPAARELAMRTTTPTDAAGEPLPPEALDAAGKPDLPDMRGSTSRAEARRRAATQGGSR